MSGATQPTLYGVGLGPGDPELVTLKAARLIRDADVIAYHSARHGRSIARRVAAPHLRGDQVEEPLVYPLTVETTDHPGGYRGALDDFYTDAAAKLAAHLDAGRDVVLLCEGDPLFYGSYMHMHSRLAGRYRTEVVPGVTSVSAAAAVTGRPLVEGEEVLTVLPGTLPPEVLAERLAAADSAAVLKLGRTFENVRKALTDAGRLDEALYVERATWDTQRVDPLSEVDPDTVPYFSLALLPSKRAADTAAVSQSGPPASGLSEQRSERGHERVSSAGREDAGHRPANAQRSEPGHVPERAAGVWTERAAEAGSASKRLSSAGREDTGHRPANAQRSEPGHVPERAAGVWTERAAEAGSASERLSSAGREDAGYRPANAERSEAMSQPANAELQRGRVVVVGLGPAGRPWLTPEAQEALAWADDLVGYGPYLDRVPPNPRQRRHASGNTVEAERALLALDLARQGRRVAVVSSGDPGVFAMASAVLEVAEQRPDVPVRVVPGLTAAQAVASKAGAPLGHDFCTMSLSDRLKPWAVVEARLVAAAVADFVIAIYNPASKTRRTQLEAAKELLLSHRAPDTPVVVGRDVGGPSESIEIVTLADLEVSTVDMRCLLIVGSSRTAVVTRADGTRQVFTPRHYPAS